MKRILIAIALACAAVSSFGATLNPVQLLNPAGSSSGQAIISTGASTAPTWGNVPVANVTGGAPLASPSFTGTVTITNTSGNSFVVNGSGNTSSGAQLFLQGNGATTPNKYLRAFNGQLQCVNNANSAVICALDDSGNLTLSGGVTAGAGSFSTLSASGAITGIPGRLLNVQVFTASGTYTPTTGANAAIVMGVGGGGAGGGAPATSAGQASIGAGGTAGAYGVIYISTGLSSQTVTIGAGGTAGAAGASGNTGGTTSFGSLMSLPGGAGGAVAGPSPLGIAVGTGTSGAPSGSGTFLVATKGQYSQAAFILSSTSFVSGNGASSPFGAGGTNALVTQAGNAGSGYGSGGGGAAAAASAAAQLGAAGQPGLIIVYEYR